MSVSTRPGDVRYCAVAKKRMVFEDWLTQPGIHEGSLPNGFLESGFALSFWEGGASLAWAIASWRDSLAKREWFRNH